MIATTRPDPATLVSQTKLAFDLVQGLYVECALLVRELEMRLHDEPEHLVIAKPGGYAVSTSRSAGLDPANVQFWPLRKFGILFVPEAAMKLESGIKQTPLDVPGLFLRFLLDDYASVTFHNEPLQQPTVIYGTFSTLVVKRRYKKLEEIPGYLESYAADVFDHLPTVEYEDAYIRLRGLFERLDLFALSDAGRVAENLAKPAARLYRSVKAETGQGSATPPVAG